MNHDDEQKKIEAALQKYTVFSVPLIQLETGASYAAVRKHIEQLQEDGGIVLTADGLNYKKNEDYISPKGLDGLSKIREKIGQLRARLAENDDDESTDDQSEYPKTFSVFDSESSVDKDEEPKFEEMLLKDWGDIDDDDDVIELDVDDPRLKDLLDFDDEPEYEWEIGGTIIDEKITFTLTDYDADDTDDENSSSDDADNTGGNADEIDNLDNVDDDVDDDGSDVKEVQSKKYLCSFLKPYRWRLIDPEYYESFSVYSGTEVECVASFAVENEDDFSIITLYNYGRCGDKFFDDLEDMLKTLKDNAEGKKPQADKSDREVELGHYSYFQPIFYGHKRFMDKDLYITLLKRTTENGSYLSADFFVSVGPLELSFQVTISEFDTTGVEDYIEEMCKNNPHVFELFGEVFATIEYEKA